LVLEYLDGMSLRSALSAQGALPAARTLHVLLQIVDAVGEAHQRGIVHRDLKPENVMLVQRGEDSDFVKVLDFGVARAEMAEPAVAATVATRAGAIFGSARYIAPECAAGGPSSPQSDVYALATLAYECLSGSTPFNGDSAIAVLLNQQSQTVPPLLDRDAARATPRPVAELIERNLSKLPAARAADARAFGRELLAAARDSGLDPGLSMRTRRGYAVPQSGVGSAHSARDGSSGAPDLPHAALAETSYPSPGSATRRALFVLACFILGAGAALGIAAELGAFTEKAPANTTFPKVNAP
jgi:serine/threonine protein kinase